MKTIPTSYSEQHFLLNFRISEKTGEAQNETIRVFGKGWVNSVMMIKKVLLGLPQEGFHLERGHADWHVKKAFWRSPISCVTQPNNSCPSTKQHRDVEKNFLFSCPDCCWITNGEASSHPSKHLVCVTCWTAACVFIISFKCINLSLESDALS